MPTPITSARRFEQPAEGPLRSQVSRTAIFPTEPRLDRKPWGGRRLAQFGLSVEGPGEPLGEALISHGSAMVVTNDGARMTLQEATSSAPDLLAGDPAGRATGSNRLFPVLVKLIDGSDDLSIQVHPDDALAREQGEPTGKTEAWHVLAAEPGSLLYLGLRDDVSAPAFLAAARADDPAAAGMLRAVPAAPGMTVLLPAGVVHALGKGVLVYEIQQPSNTTYRLYDWGRLDDMGRSRELHHDLGSRAIKPWLRPEPVEPLQMPSLFGARDLLLAVEAFALERIAAAPGDRVRLRSQESPQVLTCIEGSCILTAGSDEVRLGKGGSAIIPNRVSATLTPNPWATVLRGWTPDLERDVIMPARAFGVCDDRIARLSGGADDLARHLATG